MTSSFDLFQLEHSLDFHATPIYAWTLKHLYDFFAGPKPPRSQEAGALFQAAAQALNRSSELTPFFSRAQAWVQLLQRQGYWHEPRGSPPWPVQALDRFVKRLSLNREWVSTNHYGNRVVELWVKCTLAALCQHVRLERHAAHALPPPLTQPPPHERHRPRELRHQGAPAQRDSLEPGYASRRYPPSRHTHHPRPLPREGDQDAQPDRRHHQPSSVRSPRHAVSREIDFVVEEETAEDDVADDQASDAAENEYRHAGALDDPQASGDYDPLKDDEFWANTT